MDVEVVDASDGQVATPRSAEPMMTQVVSFERVGLQAWRLTFNDGSSSAHDVAPMVADPGAILLPPREPAYFARVVLECGALTWPNGFEIARAWLRREMDVAEELA